MKTRTTRFAGCALLCGLVALAYSNALEGPFTFDDWHVISENPAVRGPADIPAFFSDPTRFSILEGNRDYRPIFLTSMALAWWIGDGSPVPFHLVSIALHMANTLLVFALVARLARLRGATRPPLERAAADRAGLVAAALFATHPLATESIDYISSQSVPWTALFYLTSVLLFVSTHAPAADGRRPGLRAGASWLAYLAALLCKPIAITLPLVLLLFEALLGEPDPSRAGTSRWGHAAHRLRKHVPYAGVTLLYLVLRGQLFTHAFGGTPVRSYLDHALTQTRALVFYYGKATLLPLDLNLDREFRVSSGFDLAVGAAFAVLAIGGALLWRGRRQRVLVFLALWFPVALLVTTYLKVLGQVVNEHRVYLSLVGACGFAGVALVWLRTRFPVQISDLSVGRVVGERILAVLVTGVVIAGLALTRARNEEWASELTLWESAAQRGGTYRAHMNYARELDGVGRTDEALAEFQLAVELGPYAFPHMNLGLAYLRRGETARGLQHLQIAAELWPASPEVHYYYAYGLEQTGDLAAARRELLEALDRRPGWERARQALARIDPASQALDAALAEARERMAREPEQAGPRLFEIAFRMQQADRRREAIALYQELLEREPSHRQATFNLAYAYLQSDRPADLERAVALFRAVLRLDPEYTEAVFREASALWKLGRSEEAAARDRQFLAGEGNPGLRRRAEARLTRETAASS